MVMPGATHSLPFLGVSLDYIHFLPSCLLLLRNVSGDDVYHRLRTGAHFPCSFSSFVTQPEAEDPVEDSEALGDDRPQYGRILGFEGLCKRLFIHYLIGLCDE